MTEMNKIAVSLCLYEGSFRVGWSSELRNRMLNIPHDRVLLVVQPAGRSGQIGKAPGYPASRIPIHNEILNSIAIACFPTRGQKF